jgi:hypothetical protein
MRYERTFFLSLFHSIKERKERERESKEEEEMDRLVVVFGVLFLPSSHNEHNHTLHWKAHPTVHSPNKKYAELPDFVCEVLKRKDLSFPHCTIP